MVLPLRPLTVCVLVCILSYANGWWNPFGKDGIITKIVESLPGGGFFTAPIHAANNNTGHAIQAAIAGFGTLTALVVGGAPGALAVGLGFVIAGLSSAVAELVNGGHLRKRRSVHHDESRSPEEVAGLAVAYISAEANGGLHRLFSESNLSSAKEEEARHALRMHDFPRAGKAFLEAMSDRISEDAKELVPSRSKRDLLSAESGGRRSFKSAHDSYLRVDHGTRKVYFVYGPASESENWYIEDFNGKVALKGRGGPNLTGLFLQALPDGSVNLSPENPALYKYPYLFWKPFKNHGGSWSFLSVHGSWLSAREDGSVSTVINCDAWERFKLEWW